MSEQYAEKTDCLIDFYEFGCRFCGKNIRNGEQQGKRICVEHYYTLGETWNYCKESGCWNGIRKVSPTLTTGEPVRICFAHQANSNESELPLINLELTDYKKQLTDQMELFDRFRSRFESYMKKISITYELVLFMSLNGFTECIRDIECSDTENDFCISIELKPDANDDLIIVGYIRHTSKDDIEIRINKSEDIDEMMKSFVSQPEFKSKMRAKALAEINQAKK